MPKIFISYRREDTEYPAQSIYDKLVDRFGRESVVFDVDTIPLGMNFRNYLNQEVSKCDILLAVIGDRWLDILKQRIDDPNDFVRIEIQAALERDIPVVPVLVKNASVPSVMDLPSELSELAYKQAAEMRAGSDYQNHLKRLINGLENSIYSQPPPMDYPQAEEKGEEPSSPENAEKMEKRKIELHSFETTVEPLYGGITPAETDKGRIGRKKTALVSAVVALLVCLAAVFWFYLPSPGTITNSIGMRFSPIPDGSFTMGRQVSEEGQDSDETQHNVTITRPFYMQTTEVTQGQWKKVMGKNPSRFRDCGKNCPVEQVSWNDTQDFIAKLNAKEGVMYYRLPSEAEWEYACRAGSTTKYSFGDDEEQLDKYAWFDKNSNGKTHPVGTRKPNGWGLYDMYGNVWELVEDDWHDNYEGAPNDGTSWIDNPRGTYRMLRGGGWSSSYWAADSDSRSISILPEERDHFQGFRLARSVTLGP